MIVYAQNVKPGLLSSAISRREIKTVQSRLELAETVVAEKNLDGVLLQIDGIDRESRQFLETLKDKFPMLEIGIITREQEPSLPEGCTRIDITLGEEALDSEVSSFFASLAKPNRRQSNRYDWELESYLRTGGEEWRPLRLRSLSSSGAFLECEEDPPPSGSSAVLRVVFQNFKMATHCEILDPRQASSNMPPGFGVRFTGLSDSSRSVIDSIVDEAIVDVLLDSQAEPEMPSLGGEEMLTESFELI